MTSDLAAKTSLPSVLKTIINPEVGTPVEVNDLQYERPSPQTCTPPVPRTPKLLNLSSQPVRVRGLGLFMV